MTKIKSLDKVAPIKFVSSGLAEVDTLTGGYPRGRVSLVFGLAGIGKTSMLVKAMSQASSKHKILYCDVENSINSERFKELGANMANVDYYNSSILEEVCELIKKNIDKYDLIILDSVAMLVPDAEHAAEVGEQFVGLKPRLLGQWLRQIEGDLGKSKCALVLVNQVRKSMELYGDKYVLPGGMQLKFSSSLTLELKSLSADRIMDGKQQTGHWINVNVVKSKVSKPFEKTRFKLVY